MTAAEVAHVLTGWFPRFSDPAPAAGMDNGIGLASRHICREGTVHIEYVSNFAALYILYMVRLGAPAASGRDVALDIDVFAYTPTENGLLDLVRRAHAFSSFQRDRSLTESARRELAPGAAAVALRTP
jgi:hypothetical protein